MDKEKKRIIAKDLIIEGKLTELKDVFNYIDAKYISEKAGMNYYRLLRNIQNPKGFKFEDAYTLARTLQVPPDKMIALITNQIEVRKKKA